MAPRAKALFRAIGALLGFIGVCCLLAVLSMIVVGFLNFSRPGADKVVEGLSLLVMLIIALATAFCFLYVGYLAWFKPSPVAVNYVCGACCFFLWAEANSFIIHPKDPAPSVNFADAWWGLLAMVVAYYAYRYSTRYLTQKIFPAQNAPA
jgi:hypothetical protein